jgi:aspartyl protease family protein
MRRQSLAVTAFFALSTTFGFAADAPSANPAEAPTPSKPAHAKATDPSEDYLKTCGLRRADPFWVLAVESELGTKISELERFKRAVFLAQKDEAAADKIIDQKKAAITQMMQQRVALRERLAQTTNIDLHNRLVLQINDLGDKVILLEDELSKGTANSPAHDATAKNRDDYVKELLTLRKRLDACREKYDDLAADTKVAEAIEAYNKAHDKQLKLGPAATLAANDKRLKKYEELVLADAIDIKRAGGQLWEIDVVFNGNKPQTLQLDTGASLISLSYEAAKAAGITPSEKDPVIVMQLADGREVEGKKVIANSVRVGKFTVEKVECVVLGPEYKQAGCMLGQSFLKNFSYKIETEKSKLEMTKIETGAAPRK